MEIEIESFYVHKLNANVLYSLLLVWGEKMTTLQYRRVARWAGHKTGQLGTAMRVTVSWAVVVETEGYPLIAISPGLEVEPRAGLDRVIKCHDI